MAIQLSSYLWLRNNELSFLIDSRNKNHSSIPYGFSDVDRSKLKKIIDEIDSLHEPLSDRCYDSRPVIGKNILLTKGVIKVLERSTNRKKSGELFTQIHDVLKQYDFSEMMFEKMYTNLRGAFSEIDIQPNEEIKKAIAYAKGLKAMGYMHRDGSSKVFWENVLKSQ